MKTILSYVILGIFTIGTIVGYNAYLDNKKPEVNTKPIGTPITNTIMNQYTVKLKTTEGDITIALSTDQTPKTVENFVKLAKEGFYDETIFHRVLKGFMIQGGDGENHDGTGGPGYKFDDEPFNAEYTRGTVAMANSGPNTNGSQFFIMHQDYPLPKNYTIFGKVTEGMDVVDKIAEAEVSSNPYTGEPSVPVNPVKVISAEVIES